MQIPCQIHNDNSSFQESTSTKVLNHKHSPLKLENLARWRLFLAQSLYNMIGFTLYLLPIDTIDPDPEQLKITDKLTSISQKSGGGT